MVAHGHGYSIGGIGTRGQFLDPENAQKHGGHLFLGRIPVPRNALLHPFRGVLNHTDVAVKCGRYGHTLCATQLQHALDVLAEELRFDRQLVGKVLFNNGRGPSENGLQLQRVIGTYVEPDSTRVQ